MLPAVFLVRRRAEALPIALTLVLWLGCVWPSPGGERPEGPAFRVIVSNTLLDNPDLPGLVDAYRATDADLLLLQEYTPAHAAAMDTLRDSYPFQVERTGGAFGIAVFSRWPLTDTVVDDLGPVPWIRTTAVIRGTRLAVWNVHTLPPVFDGMDAVWRAQLTELADRAGAHAGPLLIGGDLNLTRHHGHYGRLAAEIDDLYGRCGRWAAWTWPAQGLLPLVKLDHLFGSAEVRCRSLEERTVPGSDHRAIVGTLVLRP